MRPWLIGLICGILAAGCLPGLPPRSLVLSTAILVPLLCWRWRPPVGYVLSGCAGGLLVGVLHGQSMLERALPIDCVAQPVTVTGDIASLVSQEAGFGGKLRQRFLLRVTSIAPGACAGPLRLRLSYYGPQMLRPGEHWQFTVRLKRPWGLANPGGYNAQDWFARERIDAVGHVLARGDAIRLPAARAAVDIHAVRQRLSERLAALLMDSQLSALLRAVTVADDAGLSPEVWQLFQWLGISHLLVISGLHISLVAGLGLLLGAGVARLAPQWPRLAALSGPGCALVLATGYAALAGLSVPTQRALLMLGVFVLAQLTGRSSTGFHSLLLAAVVVLIVNPLAGTGGGFWLSFLAVAALLWFARWQPVETGRARRALATQGYISLAMVPLTGWLFGGASTFGVGANLLMIPVIGMWVVPLALLGALSFFAGLGVEQHCWLLAAWPLERLLPLLDVVATRGGVWAYPDIQPGVVALLAGLIAAVLLATPGRRRLLACVLVLFLPGLLPTPAGDDNAPGDTLVTVLDVGQGTAVVVRAGDHTLVYDSGGGNPAGWNAGAAVVLPYLRAQGVRALDTLMISHGDMDHRAGAPAILDRLPVARLRYGPDVAAMPGGQPCRAGEAWRWPGGQFFQVLSPEHAATGPDNDGSCVLQIVIGEHRLLLPGDIGEVRERSLVSYWREDLRADWLLLPHHGSASSSSVVLLKTVAPQIAVVSAGYANPFGHPHPRVVQRLTGLGVAVWDTARDGALEFTYSPGKPVEIRANRTVRRRYWH